jgi:hypothetical protein
LDKSIIDNILEKAKSTPLQRPEAKKVPSKFFDKPEAERKRIVGEKAWASYDKKHAEKSEDSDLVKSIDSLIEKAVYGAGASHGKVERGSGKDSSKPGKVKSPALSEERKKELLSNVSKKAGSRASIEGLHKRASEEDKIAAESQKHYESRTKSLDERTTDLVKSLNVDYGPRKSGVKRHGRKQDPDSNLHPRDNERSDSNSDTRGPLPSDADSAKKSLDSDLEKANKLITPKEFDDSKVKLAKKHGLMKEGPEDKGKYVPGSKKFNNPQDSQDPKIRYKSLDERTCDLHKGFAPEKVGGAVGREYVKNADSDKAKRVAVKFHFKNAKNPEAQSKFGEAMTDEVWAHNLKLAKKSQQDVMNTWQTDSAYITKGGRVVVQGGQPATLVKDGQRPPGRTPTYQQTDEKQREVDSGKIERERKAKKKVADLGAE